MTTLLSVFKTVHFLKLFLKKEFSCILKCKAKVKPTDFFFMTFVSTGIIFAVVADKKFSISILGFES